MTDVLRAGPGSPDLDVRHLATLREVARRRSFSAAARSLNFTPSAVSHHMARLERDAGQALLDRAARGRRLTPAGEALLEHADAILGALEQADAEIRRLSDAPAPALRIGSFPAATAGVVASALRSLKERFPKTAFELADGEPHESAARLKRGELDVAVTFELGGPPAGSSDGGRSPRAGEALECEDLFDDPFMLVAPRDHPLAGEEVCSLRSLDGEVLIGGPGGCAPWGPELQAACAREGAEPHFEDCYGTANAQGLQSFVAAGFGVTLMPRLELGHLRAGLCARPLAGGPVRHVRLARPAGSRLDPVAAALAELLRAATAPAPAPSRSPTPR